MGGTYGLLSSKRQAILFHHPITSNVFFNMDKVQSFVLMSKGKWHMIIEVSSYKRHPENKQAFVVNLHQYFVVFTSATNNSNILLSDDQQAGPIQERPGKYGRYSISISRKWRHNIVKNPSLHNVLTKGAQPKSMVNSVLIEGCTSRSINGVFPT